MDFKKIIEHDKSVYRKLSSFQLPNSFKLIGVGVFLFGLTALISLRFLEGDPIWMKDFLRRILLVGLLMISISKEKNEDEMMVYLRMKSYSIGFITGIFYALVQPYVNYGVAAIIAPAKASLAMSYFEVLVFILLVQLLYFEQMKRRC